MKKEKLILSALLLLSACTNQSNNSKVSSSLLDDSIPVISSSDSSTVESTTNSTSIADSTPSTSTTNSSTNSSVVDSSLVDSSLNSTSIELPTLSGYYASAANKVGFTLKTALYNIIKDHTSVSYNTVREKQKIIDLKPDGTMWDVYSDVPGGTPPYTFSTSKTCGNYSGEGDCWNREHSVPASWFSDKSPMYSDIFHLYPTDGYVNGRRSNYPFGEVASATWTSKNGSKLGSGTSASGYTGTVFEPINEYKGDFARTYFYMATRYENVVSGWSSAMLNKTSNQVFTTWAINLLLKWHELDPVSEKEVKRNEAIYTSIQHNRNPFIDYPEFAQLIWKN